VSQSVVASKWMKQADVESSVIADRVNSESNAIGRVGSYVCSYCSS